VSFSVVSCAAYLVIARSVSITFIQA
jgi:hypothetical protein